MATTSTLWTERLQKAISFVYHDIWEFTAEPRTNSFPLIGGGPWKVFLIVGVYLALTMRILPAVMKNRKPFDLRSTMVVYNLLMVMLNGVGCIIGFYLSNYGLRTWACECSTPEDDSPSTWIMIYLGYFYFLSKFFDLMDTFFFVLRKKNEHLSFLHMFHHGMMPFVAWVGVKYFHFNNGFTGLFNSFIHAVMYAYYALSAMGPAYKQYTWWKKYLTQMQMFQFACVLCHSLYSLLSPSCCWSKYIAAMEGTYALIFFVLFSSFYIKSYQSARKADARARADALAASKSSSSRTLKQE
jgi:elongation of very long chain fatty acids protein 7